MRNAEPKGATPLGRLRLAVVIVTLDRPEYVERALSHWDKSTRRPDQVVVVDASKDAEKQRTEVIRRHSRLFVNGAYIVADRASTAGQRNLSLSFVTADVVLFADDDLLPAPNLVERMLEVFEADKDERIGAASGWGFEWRRPWRRLVWAVSTPIRPYVARFGLTKEQALPRHVQVPQSILRQFSLTRVRELRSCAMAVRTPLAKSLRFDDHMDGYCFAEDFDLSYRIGRTHALVRRNDTLLNFSIAAGTAVPAVKYFFLSWINPAYLIEKLRLGEPSRRALSRRLSLDKWIRRITRVLHWRAKWRVPRQWFEVAEAMIHYIQDGHPANLTVRFGSLQTFVLSLSEDVGFSERLLSWPDEVAPIGSVRNVV